jgi:hypothetical protein
MSMNAERLRRWHALCHRWKESGYDSLASAEQTWMNVRALIDSIRNGGAISYFYNSGADNLSDCLTDLDRLGADDVKALVEEVCSLFPKPVPRGIEERNAIIDSWPDHSVDVTLERVDDALMPKMSGLEAKLDAFLLTQKL